MNRTERTTREQERKKKLKERSEQLVNLLKFDKQGKYLGRV